MNTKARHQEILAAAAVALERLGGIVEIDALRQEERTLRLREMASRIREATGCTPDTARRNVTKILQRARHPLNDIDQWGGAGRGAGRFPLPESRKRVPVSTRLAPGSKELAQAIAEVKELPGWGRSVDQALVRWVEGDRELKVKLTQMGIIVKS